MWIGHLYKEDRGGEGDGGAKKLMDESREKTKGVQFNSTEVIRGLREER